MPALRDQLSLPEGKGLLVVFIAPKSPAATAGLLQHDILMRGGDKPLADPRDLAQAVEATKTGKLKIELIRRGKPKTIEAAPAKRPRMEGVVTTEVSSEPADWGMVREWFGKMAPGGTGAEGRQFEFHVLHPGAIVPKDVLVSKPLPANLSVSVTREGDKPAKISVRRGNEKWELTDKELDKLPADVRPFVDQMLGHGMWGAFTTSSSAAVASSAKTATVTISPGSAVAYGVARGVATAGPTIEKRTIEKRLDEMNARMDRLLALVEKMAEGRQSKAALEDKKK